MPLPLDDFFHRHDADSSLSSTFKRSFKLSSTPQPSKINISFPHFPDIKYELYRFQHFSPLHPPFALIQQN